MRSIHVVYGSAWSGRATRAHSLAVAQPESLVHEIGTEHDLAMIMNSRYRRCIAILQAGDETHARSRLRALAAAARTPLCDVTYEAAPLHL